MNVQKHLAKIMQIQREEQKTRALFDLARKLGCSLERLDVYDDTPRDYAEQATVQRIQEAARGRREARLWMVALVSAVASAMSAAAAIGAVIVALSRT